MTSYLACSTCNKQQWQQYGRAMVKTFDRFWPKEILLDFYAEGFEPDIEGSWRDLDEAAPWLKDFKKRYGGNPRNTGGAGRRDYRRDAIRFCHKIGALGAAAEGADCDVLLWLDADIVTFAPVTRAWLDSLFPPAAHLGWLDRSGVYPECSFVLMRLPQSQELIERMVAMYKTGNVFHLSETHDSYVLQHVATAMQNEGKLKIHSLSGAGRVHTGHPFVNSPLAACLDHLKGEVRKQRGASLPTDLKIRRSEPYWEKIRKGIASS
jgi:hypothetical protein